MLKRLAALRLDRLGDDAGAFALLEDLVVAEIADAEVRRRFRQAATAVDRYADARRILLDAAERSKDPILSLLVGAELAQFSLEAGDQEAARQTFEQLLEEAIDPAVLLTAAKGLAEIYGSAQPERLAHALATIAEHETDDAARWAVTARLAKLYQEVLSDAASAVRTWRKLLASPLETQALDALEKLYEAVGQLRELADILDLRAKKETNPARARALAFRATDLRSARLKSREVAIEAWQQFLRTHGPFHDAHVRLLPLLEKEEKWAELAEVLRAEVELASEAEKAPLLCKLGVLALERQRDVGAAIGAFERALHFDAKDEISRQRLEGLLNDAEHGPAAAMVLEPLYRAEGNAQGLLLILSAQLELSTEVGGRLAILGEAVALLDRDLGQLPRALELAGTALRESVLGDRSQMAVWIGRIEELSARHNDPQAKAALLARALGEHRIDGPELLALAIKTGDALLVAGDGARALAVYRAAMTFDTTSPELVERVEVLVLQRGNPAERLAVHRASLARCTDKTRRRDILHQIARIEQGELSDTAAAIATWQSAIAEDPADVVAQEALLASYAAIGDYRALYAELARGLASAEGQRRISILLKLAEAAAKSGQPDRALSHYQELLAIGDLSEEVLTLIERAAESVNDAETMVGVLERRVAASPDAASSALYLERLGDVQAERRGNIPAALAAWKQAAKLCEESAAPPERTRELYAKVSAADPGDRQASQRLVDLYVRGGDLRQLPAVYSNLLRNAKDERQALNLIAAMEPWAVRAGASQEFSDAVDLTLARYVGAAATHLT